MCFEMMVMLLSAPILTKAWGANGGAVLAGGPRATARRVEPAHSNPMVSAVTAAPAPFRNSRRAGRGGKTGRLLMTSSLRCGCRGVNRGPYARIRCTATDVAAHRAIDVRIAGRGILLEQ